MTRVFNCDEAAFSLCPKGDQVLVRKGQESVYSIVNADEKECLTTLITGMFILVFILIISLLMLQSLLTIRHFTISGNAAEEVAPPVIILKYERLPKNIVASVPGHWDIVKSGNGGITGMSFYKYIVNIFHPLL